MAFFLKQKHTKDGMTEFQTKLNYQRITKCSGHENVQNFYFHCLL